MVTANVTNTRLSSAEVAAQRAERIAQAHSRIEEAVTRIQSGEDWRNYLTLQSRLHAYSGNNTLLIWLQHGEAYRHGMVTTPWPTYVAAFHTWKALGRSVARGRHGYQILAPSRRTVGAAVRAEGMSRPLERGESAHSGEPLERRQVIKGFRVEHVFAAVQTSGADLPAPPTPEPLNGEAPAGLWDTIEDHIASLGYTVWMVPSAVKVSGANGQTSCGSKRVEIRSDMHPAARVKTAIHELAHCLLHEPQGFAAAYEDRSRPTRAVMEFEADSVAFIFADAHGLSTDGYSFPYVAAWAGPDGVATRASMTRVAAAAQRVINASSVELSPGGRAPGIEQALKARSSTTITAPFRYAGREPPVARSGIEGVAS